MKQFVNGRRLQFMSLKSVRRCPHSAAGSTSTGMGSFQGRPYRMISAAAIMLALLGVMLQGAAATVVLATPSNDSLPFSDMEAGFAPRVPQAGILGLLYPAEPLNACEPLTTGPALDQSPFSAFVVVERGVCTFQEKVRHAQYAGFAAVLVYNNQDDRDLVIMSGDSTGIEIPAVFVSKAAGAVLLKYAGDPRTRCYILPAFDYPVWSVMAVAFISLLAVTAVLATFFFVRRHRLRRLGSRLLLPRAEASGLTASEVKALPSLIFRCVDEEASSETCVICMEEYENGQKLRILPCRHAFHAVCVDQWLMTRKPFCPVCKRDAHAKAEGPSMTENTPLLTARFPIVSPPAATQTSPSGSNNGSFACSCSPIPVPSHGSSSSAYASPLSSPALQHHQSSCPGLSSSCSSYATCPARQSSDEISRTSSSASRSARAVAASSWPGRD